MRKLNIGCGDKIEKGYINIDIRDLPGVDIIADIRNLPFENNSVLEIKAIDCYEHVGHPDSLSMLKHWHDLLMIGGLLTIQSPCLDTIINDLMKADTLFHIEICIAAIYGGQDYPENTHKTICQSSLLNHYLAQVGMEVIDTQFVGYNIISKSIRRT